MLSDAGRGKRDIQSGKVVNMKKLVGMVLMLSMITGCEPSAESKWGSVGIAKAEGAATVRIRTEHLPLKTPGNWRLTKRLLDRMYGVANYKPGERCWQAWIDLTEEDGQSSWYCMSAARLDKVTVGDETRWYIQTSGKTEDAGHPTLGTVGFFIINAQTEAVIASEPITEFPVGYGEGPGAMELVQLSDSGYFGWFHEGGFMFQGIITTFPVFAAPMGKKVVSIQGNLPGVREDEQQFEYGYRVDRSDKTAAVYPVVVIEKNTETGKTRTFRAIFERERWAYRCNDGACRQ